VCKVRLVLPGSLVQPAPSARKECRVTSAPQVPQVWQVRRVRKAWWGPRDRKETRARLERLAVLVCRAHKDRKVTRVRPVQPEASGKRDHRESKDLRD